jgi:hypothetical protein
MYIGHSGYMAEMCGKSYPHCVLKNRLNVVSMWGDHVGTARARDARRRSEHVFEKAQLSYLSITTSYLSIVTSNLSVTRGHETVTLRSDVVMLRIYVIALKRSTLMLKISFRSSSSTHAQLVLRSSSCCGLCISRT